MEYKNGENWCLKVKKSEAGKTGRGATLLLCGCIRNKAKYIEFVIGHFTNENMDSTDGPNPIFLLFFNRFFFFFFYENYSLDTQELFTSTLNFQKYSKWQLTTICC